MKLEQIEKTLADFSKIQELAAPIAQRMHDVKSERGYSADIEPYHIQVVDGDLYAEYTEYGPCSYAEEHSMRIPLEYLTDPNWEKKLEQQVAEERRMRMSLLMKREEREHQEQLERERQQYLELKKKFEGEEQ